MIINKTWDLVSRELMENKGELKMTAKKEPKEESKLARMQKETGMYETQKELFEKTAQEAQILRSDVQDLHKVLNQTNPLAAELFRIEVLPLAVALEATLANLQKLE